VSGRVSGCLISNFGSLGFGLGWILDHLILDFRVVRVRIRSSFGLSDLGSSWVFALFRFRSGRASSFLIRVITNFGSFGFGSGQFTF
jgi:hypothetical protein